jgi:hypothetical protein
MKPWMIWDIERKREERERENEAARGLYLPPPSPPGWEPEVDGGKPPQKIAKESR